MENVQAKAKKVLSSLVNAMIDHDNEEWPPECIMFTYQPVRPLRGRTVDADSDDKEQRPLYGNL